MIKKILGSAFLIISVVGGAVAADFFKHASQDNGTEHSAEKKDKNSKENKKKKDDGDGSTQVEGPSYLKFNRQFVVPVLKGKKIDALVIMNLSFELTDDAPENIYTFEPKLRDAVVRELLAMSDQGVFGPELTTPQNYEIMRSTLLEAGQQVVTNGIQDVLILDIARQDQ